MERNKEASTGSDSRLHLRHNMTTLPPNTGALRTQKPSWPSNHFTTPRDLNLSLSSQRPFSPVPPHLLGGEEGAQQTMREQSFGPAPPELLPSALPSRIFGSLPLRKAQHKHSAQHCSKQTVPPSLPKSCPGPAAQPQPLPSV